MELSTRVVMAPLTRSRAPGGIPNEMMARYYAQRANPATGASLIISEGAGISARSFGYAGVPGIYNEEHAAGWKLVTDAVHEQGGRIFCQLWHVGRVSHTACSPRRAPPLRRRPFAPKRKPTCPLPAAPPAAAACARPASRAS